MVDWQSVAREYKERKTEQTLAALSVETVADAVLYMHAGLYMKVRDIIAHFDMHSAWFNYLVNWSRLPPEVQTLFSLESYVRDRLPLADAPMIAASPAHKQISGAQNLVRSRQKKKKPSV